MVSELQDHYEFIKTYLPKYLSQELSEKLFNDIKENFPYSTDPHILYSRLPDLTIYYQGDGIDEMIFSQLDEYGKDFETLYLRSAIISNTCDISQDNKRIVTPNPQIVLSAIFKLSDYRKAHFFC